MKNLRVLLIDDEIDFNELVKTMLEFHDFSVTALDNPEKVFSVLESSDFDIVVTDLMMPGLDGFHLISKIRQNLRYVHTPILVLTAKLLSDDERKFLFQKSAHCLLKPFEPQGLVDTICSLVKAA